MASLSQSLRLPSFHAVLQEVELLCTSSWRDEKQKINNLTFTIRNLLLITQPQPVYLAAEPLFSLVSDDCPTTRSLLGD